MSMDDDVTRLPTDEGEHVGLLRVGQVFGSYRVLRLLGRGGMGEVYAVKHAVLGTEHALKLIKREISSQPDAKKRFQDEARAMAKLAHPGIVHVDDFGETEGLTWLRMELADGWSDGGDGVCASLSEWLRGRVPLAEDEVRGILGQVLSGLGHAHAADAVHRDLKPGNLLLFGGGVVKIADFGLVKLAGEQWVQSQVQQSVARSMSMSDRETVGPGGGDSKSTHLTGTSSKALLGTYAYMSPEQKRGEGADARSDLYAVGLMAFQMLTGEESVGLEMPTDIRPELDAGWDGWVKRAIAGNADRRFASAAEMRAAMPGAEGATDFPKPSDETTAPVRPKVVPVRRGGFEWGGRLYTAARELGEAMNAAEKATLTGEDVELLCAWLESGLGDRALASRVRRYASTEGLRGAAELQCGVGCLLSGGERVFWKGRAVDAEALWQDVDTSRALERVCAGLSPVWVDNAVVGLLRQAKERADGLRGRGVSVNDYAVRRWTLAPEGVLMKKAEELRARLWSSANERLSGIIREGAGGAADALLLLCAAWSEFRTREGEWESLCAQSREVLGDWLDKLKAVAGEGFASWWRGGGGIERGEPPRRIASKELASASEALETTRRELREKGGAVLGDALEERLGKDFGSLAEELVTLLGALEEALAQQQGFADLLSRGCLETARRAQSLGARLFAEVDYGELEAHLQAAEADWQEPLQAVDAALVGMRARRWWRVVPFGHVSARRRLGGWLSELRSLRARLEAARTKAVERLDAPSLEKVKGLLDGGLAKLGSREGELEVLLKRTGRWGMVSLALWGTAAATVVSALWLWQLWEGTGLFVETDPPGARVAVYDGSGALVEHPRVRLLPGEYRVVLEDPRYEAAEERIEIGLGRVERVTLSAERAYGEVEFRVSGPGRGEWELYVAGERMRPDTRRRLRLAAGEVYTYEIKARGYADAGGGVRVKAGQTQLVEVDLVPGQNAEVELPGGVKMSFTWVRAMNLWVGTYEVTNAEFRAFRSGHNSGNNFNGARQPVVMVSYEDAVAFCDWLTERERSAGRLPAGYRYRLASGDEWTRFARCGTNRTYPWGNSMPPTRGNYSNIISNYSSGAGRPVNVENAGGNEWGLYGVGGNVWEWTSEQRGSSRVVRGASWSANSERNLRVELRYTRPPSRRLNYFGFRVLLGPAGGGG